MNDIVSISKLKKKGVYLYLTKYAIITGWFICLFTLLTTDLVKNNRINLELHFAILLPLGFLFVLCQIGFSWFFPHEIAIHNDRILAVGPWNIKHTITYDKIRTILYNEQKMVIQKKFGVNKIFIGKSIDPKREIQKNLLNVLKGYSGIRFVRNANT